MTITQWTNPFHLQQKNFLRRRFIEAKPFPHLVLHDFLLQPKAMSLLRALRQEQWRLKDADLFRFHQTHDLQSSSNTFIRDYYRFFSSRAFLQFIETITSTTPLRSIDAAGQTYAAGDHLLPHDDRLAGRKIAYVLNLTKGFTEKDGGQLDFFSCHQKTGDPAAIAKSFTPRFNTLFLFRVSEHSFHQVREVLSNKKRVSIGGWFHG